ncbi:hypothetical protein VPH35_107741 [Triticum aestivum]
MEEGAAAMAALSLPGDIVLEILVRVKDPAALFRCTMACNHWRRLVVDPSFLRRHWPEDTFWAPSLMPVFVVVYLRQDPPPEPWFVPVRRSPMGPCRRTLASIVSTTRADLFKYAVPIVSRHNLLLVRLEVLAETVTPNQTILQLAVCDVLVGTCDRLPPLKFSSNFIDCNSNGYAILTAADCHELSPWSNTWPFFKVVIIGSSYGFLKYDLHVFSSDKASWTVSTNCFGGNAPPKGYWSFSDAIVRRGTAHWLLYYGECS